MRKKQIEKVREEFERLDLSRWHILTYDELLKVNGGSGSDSNDSDDETVESESEETPDEGAETATESTTGEEGVGEPRADPTSESTSSGTNSDSESGGHEIENTVEAVANAEVGDTLTRDDGTQVTISQGDIDWAQEHCDSYGKNGEEEKEESPAKESDLQTTEEADCSKTEQEEGGSRRIENTDEAVANAKPGDTLVRDDGTVVTLKEVDIEQAQEKLGIGEHKEDEKSPSKEGELAEKSSGENKNTKGENAAEERAYINSKLDTPKNGNILLFDTGTVIKAAEKPVERIDSAYLSPFGEQPHIQNTFNQTKTEKQVYAEAEFVDKKGETSCNLGAGLMSVSTKLSNTSILYTEANLDIANANFNFGVTDTGLHGGFGVNGISASGGIGLDFDKASIHLGGGVGFNASFGVSVDVSNGFHITLDAAVIIGGSIDLRLGGHRD